MDKTGFQPAQEEGLPRVGADRGAHCPEANVPHLGRDLMSLHHIVT